MKGNVGTISSTVVTPADKPSIALQGGQLNFISAMGPAGNKSLPEWLKYRDLMKVLLAEKQD